MYMINPITYCLFEPGPCHSDTACSMTITAMPARISEGSAALYYIVVLTLFSERMESRVLTISVSDVCFVCITQVVLKIFIL